MAAVQEKRKRITELSNFTRNVNKLIKLFDAAAPASLVNPQYEKVQDCYDKLEAAHNAFLSATDIEDTEHDKDGVAYMNDPDKRHDEVLERYATYLKTDAEQQEANRRTREDDTRAKEKETREQIEHEAKAAEEAKLKDDLQRQFDTQKVQLSASIAAFKRLTLNVKDSWWCISCG